MKRWLDEMLVGVGLMGYVALGLALLILSSCAVLWILGIAH